MRAPVLNPCNRNTVALHTYSSKLTTAGHEHEPEIFYKVLVCSVDGFIKLGFSNEVCEDLS